MSDFVRLTPASTQATDQHDVREIVVNRQYISHLFQRHAYTEVHFGNGDDTTNVRESPTEILRMESWACGSRPQPPAAEPLAGSR